MRLTYPTRHAVGPYRLVRIRMRGGYAIRDDRTRRYAVTTAHPVTGRPIPRLYPLGTAVQLMQRLAADEA